MFERANTFRCKAIAVKFCAGNESLLLVCIFITPIRQYLSNFPLRRNPSIILEAKPIRREKKGRIEAYPKLLN